MNKYKIVRNYFNGSSRAVNGLSGLTLEEAQEHCKSPEASSTTCTASVGRKRTQQRGPWFDSYNRI